MPPITVREAIDKSSTYLASAGCASSRLEAELLVGKCLELDRVQLYVQYDRVLDESELVHLRSLITARAKDRVPVAHLTGHRYFLGLDLLIPPGVFIPRPETEELVEAAIDRLAAVGERELELLDLCTGSGAIAISLAKRFAAARITAVEIDPVAAAAARANVERFGLAGRVMVMEGDLWSAVPHGSTFHAVLSNPPYIPTSRLAALPLEILRHEPQKALDGGPDGLDLIRRIFAGAKKALKDGGFCAIEHDCADEEELIAMARSHGFENIELKRDLAGLPRLILAGLS